MRNKILLSLIFLSILIIGCSKPAANNSSINITLDTNNSVVTNYSEIINDTVINETVVLNDTVYNNTTNITINTTINTTVVETPKDDSEYLRYRDTDLIDESISDIESLT